MNLPRPPHVFLALVTPALALLASCETERGTNTAVPPATESAMTGPSASARGPSASAAGPSASAPTASGPSASAAPDAGGSAPRPTDTFATARGDLTVTPVRHATVILAWGGEIIWVDPVSDAPGLDALPKADLVLITDIHPDHFDAAAIEKVKKPSAAVLAPPVVAEKLPGALALKNGEEKMLSGVGIEAVPMYNLQRGPAPGKLFHDKGRGNGYVLTFAKTRVYLSGDTECIDEMKALRDIDVAFVAMNLPYTMPPSEAAQCIRAFAPKVVLPYHHRGSDLKELASGLAGAPTEIRVRAWY